MCIRDSLISYLNAFYGTYNIQLFGPSSWLRFTAIDLEYLHNLEYTYFTPFYMDYGNIRTKQFLMDFRQQYGFEPDHSSIHGFNFALLGYDVMYQFVRAYAKYGQNFGCCMESIPDKGLICDYNFMRPSIIDGFQNESGAIIKYTREFDVKKVMDIK